MGDTSRSVPTTIFVKEADRVGDHEVATVFREIRNDKQGHLQSFEQASFELKQLALLQL